MNRHFILALLPLAACNCLETGGNSRGGRFEAAVPGALVAGTSYDLQVFDYEFDRSMPTTVSAASSSDDSIVSVTVGEEGVVSLDAKKEGTFALDFTADADGDDLADAFDLRSIQAVRVELAHLCDATYVANRPADVQFWFSDATRLQGNGYGWYPVVVADATLEEASSTAHTLRIALGDADATVTSSLAPSNEQPAQLALDVVPMTAIDGLAIVDEHHSPVINGRRLDRDQELAIRVVPSMASRALCGARVESELEVSEDSDCMFAAARGSEDLTRTIATNGELIVVVAVAYGICQITAKLLGEGLTEILDLDVSEPPRSSSSDFD